MPRLRGVRPSVGLVAKLTYPNCAFEACSRVAGWRLRDKSVSSHIQVPIMRRWLEIVCSGNNARGRFLSASCNSALPRHAT